MCALKHVGLLTKNVVLTQATQKHAVLKSANILLNKRGEIPPLHNTYSLAWQPAITVCALTLSSGCSPHPQTYPKFRHFSKFPLFVVHWQIHFFLLAQKYPFFQRPRTRRILELQTCKQSFYDLQIP